MADNVVSTKKRSKKADKYDGKTREDLLTICKEMDEWNGALENRIIELEARLKNSEKERDSIIKELEAKNKENERIWKVVTSAIDIKDMIDDIEDAAKDLKKASMAIWGADEDKDDDD